MMNKPELTELIQNYNRGACSDWKNGDFIFKRFLCCESLF